MPREVTQDCSMQAKTKSDDRVLCSRCYKYKMSTEYETSKAGRRNRMCKSCARFSIPEKYERLDADLYIERLRGQKGSFLQQEEETKARERRRSSACRLSRHSWCRVSRDDPTCSLAFALHAQGRRHALLSLLECGIAEKSGAGNTRHRRQDGRHQGGVSGRQRLRGRSQPREAVSASDDELAR
eukprot:159416-Hanusia_phi.AAC.4